MKRHLYGFFEHANEMFCESLRNHSLTMFVHHQTIVFQSSLRKHHGQDASMQLLIRMMMTMIREQQIERRRR